MVSYNAFFKCAYIMHPQTYWVKVQNDGGIGSAIKSRHLLPYETICRPMKQISHLYSPGNQISEGLGNPVDVPWLLLLKV